MPIAQFVYDVVKQQEELVMTYESPEILEHAKKIAFYSAMLDAAIDDPLDAPDDQEEILEYFNNLLTELIESYQKLIHAVL